MFEKYESEYFLSEALVSREEFHPLPKRGERALWDNVDEEVRSYYMARAEELLEKPVCGLRHQTIWNTVRMEIVPILRTNITQDNFADCEI